ncbi:hypothetical protein AUC61_23980 [Pseudomonas sp. S25]|uniref:Lysozyme n=1 Tax=Pseudomonas maioricensis TaxID=1766623 RepID=A0ABS9ZPU2_9PSED|nr:lysozyme [Pseudomonas sp. S25]MCI8212595.1 hypothetical protein [Pseudomonas sp. S25]
MAKVTLPKAIFAAIAAGATAFGIMDKAVPIVEGNPLVAYLDVGGVPTVCGGVTKGVRLGDVETPAGCQRRNAEAIAVGLADVERCALTPKPMPETMKAAWGLFAYNVGGGNFCASTAVKLLRAGDFPAACAQLDRWRFVAGKDCRLASSGCPGIIHRRALERTLCEWDL